MNVKPILLLVAACLGIAACNQQEQKTVQVTPVAPKKTGPEEPFKYHKMIEVAPGNYYDVLSWGRGTAGGGAYMILRSDSADQQYNSTTGDLEGPIQDVLNADLDIDGNPEIIIQAKSIDTTRFTNVFAYEYHDDNAQKLDFPRLTSSQRKGYRGDDNFYIKDNKLMREYPIYEGTGKEAKPSGQKRLLEYSLHGSSFSAKQVSKDSTSTSSSASTEKSASVPVAVPKTEPSHKTESSHKSTSSHKKQSSSSKHHKATESHKKHKPEVKKKKKKHRR